MASSSSNKKTMDVSKPGNVPADASARPLIVSHRPMVQDPMMKSDKGISELDSAEEVTEVKSSPTSGEKVIKPLDHSSETEASDLEQSAEVAAGSKAKAEDKEAPKPDTEIDPKDSKTEKETGKEDTKTPEAEDEPKPETESKKTSNSSEAAEVDAVLEQGEASKQTEEQEADQAAQQEAAKREHLQKLIDNKKYFVKTGQVARRRNNRIAIAFVVLLLVVAGLYLAVDAKLIKTGFDVPIHVIHT